MKKFLMIFMFLFISLIIKATTYYIDPNGNNSNNGSSGSPWKTLFYASTRVTNSGDIIHVNAGTYTETSQSQLAVGVSIEGDDMVTTTVVSNISSGLLLSLTSTHGTNGNQHISGINFNGNNNTYYAIEVYGRSNVSIVFCTFVDFYQYGIKMFGQTKGESESTSVPYATGNSVHDCTITNCAYYQSGSGGGANVFVACQKGFQVYNCNITQSRPAYTNGCGVKTDGWTKGMKIYNNTLIGQILSDKEVADSWDFAIEMWGDFGSIAEGIEIYNNVILNWEIDISGRITQKGGYNFGCSIHDNWIGCLVLPPVSKIGIILEANTSLDNIWIYNNHFKNIKTGISFYVTNQLPLPISFTNIFICYNIFEELGYDVDGADARAFMWYNGSGTTHIMNNIMICNNVMTANARVGTSSDAISLRSQSGVTSSNFFIKNNIITGFAGYCVSNRNWSAGSGTITNLLLQNNVFYSNGHSNLPNITVTVPGYVNSGNLTSNPLFVLGTDFHLQGTSPVIGTGITINIPILN